MITDHNKGLFSAGHGRARAAELVKQNLFTSLILTSSFPLIPSLH
ncbi:Os09g0378200 [Oryza sativa Japonica Group]|uniref:Os09g0378200 protein n=1 Tax=Oryza sativa subsp. japonica TaxID=39947 RepID=A0A0P0XMF1_ORYSJ|nr:hypothetical protein EE612_047453 [Oryza sativa]BAT07828.1 Os09g0378200 [Oryza sativa Japonica Group]